MRVGILNLAENVLFDSQIGVHCTACEWNIRSSDLGREECPMFR